jgi:hypothetical protein
MAFDTRIWFGRLGAMAAIVHPKGVFSADRERSIDRFQLGDGGYRLDQMIGGSRSYVIPYGGLTREAFGTLQAFADGHEGPGPFVLLDPGQRNMLTPNVSAATSVTNGTDNFTVAGSGCTIASSATYTDAGPRTLAWTFNFSAPGTGAALTIDWPSSTFRYGVPAVSGRALCFSFQVRGGGTDAVVTYTPRIAWRSATGALISTTSGSTVASAAATWSDRPATFVTGSPPAGAVYADPCVAYTSGVSAGSIGYFRRFMLNEGATPDATWMPGTGVWPVKVTGLDDRWAGQWPEYRDSPGFTLQEDTS